MATAKELTFAFQVFTKYSEEDCLLDSQRDEIRVNVNPEDVSEEDKKKLDEVGFYPDKSGPIHHFYHFT